MNQCLLVSFRWFLLSQIVFGISWVFPFQEQISDFTNLNFEDNLSDISGGIGFVFLIISILKLKPNKQSQSDA